MDVQKFAKKQGFAGAKKIAPWRNYVCYECLTGNDDPEEAIGFPQIILARPGVLRLALYDEAMAYLHEVVMAQ